MAVNKHLFTSLVGTICLMATTGCATNSITLPHWFAQEPAQTEPADPVMKSQQQMMAEQGIYYRPDSRSQMQSHPQQPQSGESLWLTPKQLYKPDYTHKSLSDYAEQLAMQLMSKGRQLSARSLVGVTSFVRLDDTLNRSNVLGNQLSELFINEIQEYGISVVDFKTTGDISVRSNGDFVFSRDTYDLANDLAVDFVLSGTLIRNEKGVKVNARIISMNNRVVVSSATLFIPHFVIEELEPKFVMM